MASTTIRRSARTLVLFLTGLAILFGLVALAGSWKPSLGLDLQGGTRINLTAENDPSEENLEEARQIIDSRVNGSGVVEASVRTEAGRHIIVEIPGETRRDLIETVQRQAQLRFRLVACSQGQEFSPCAGGGAADLSQQGLNRTAPAVGRSGENQGNQNDGQNGNQNGDGEGGQDGGAQQGTPNEIPAPPAGPQLSEKDEITVPDALAWKDNPNQAAIQAYNELECPQPEQTEEDEPVTPAPINVEDDPDKPLATCQYREDVGQSVKYLLSPAVVEGTSLTDAYAGIPQNSAQYVVNLEIGGQGREAFADVSRALVGTGDQFAIVLDGQVISAPTMEGLITNGRAQISGDFTQQSAEDLATSLRYGSLPIAFERQPSVETIGPSLAGDQLNAGLIAGAIGLLLVLLYCLAYYRLLGMIVLCSFVFAGTTLYGLVLLLSETAGFTLTLPGIAGLIIAVGITADSFIIFFERMRDEMRDGKSMRVAVETGWRRARTTRIAANTVSLLSALVLYIFATGAVKGFGFALGLTTLADLAVLFWFTKPTVSLLAKYPLFNNGNKLSGLSAGTLGMDQVPAGGTVGGRSR